MAVLGGVAVSYERGAPVTVRLLSQYPKKKAPTVEAMAPLNPNKPLSSAGADSTVALTHAALLAALH